MLKKRTVLSNRPDYKEGEMSDAIAFGAYRRITSFSAGLLCLAKPHPQ